MFVDNASIHYKVQDIKEVVVKLNNSCTYSTYLH